MKDQNVHRKKPETFKTKSKREIRKMPLQSVNDYFRQRRKYLYENHLPLNDRRILPKTIRKTAISGILAMDQIFSRRKVQVVSDRHIDSGKTHIYAATHVGPGDIETILSVINENAFLLQGDAGEGYRNFGGAFLDFNGRICFDTGYQYQEYMKKRTVIRNCVSKTILKKVDELILDRHIGEMACIELLNRGDNVLLFPEGAYNVSRKPLMPLFQGAVRMAMKSERDVDMIPVALVRRNHGHWFQVMIGENINLDESTASEAAYFTEKLANSLKSMLSELGRKEDLDDDAYLKHLTDVFDKPIDGYTLDVALHGCRFEPDDNDRKVIRKALEKTSPDRVAYV